KGFQYLQEFKLDPVHTWTYAIGYTVMDKRVFMVNGRSATVVQYRLKPATRGNKPGVKLTWRPMLSFVDYHQLQQQADDFNGELSSKRGTIAMTPVAGMPSIYFALDAADIAVTGYWYRHFAY